MQKDSKIFLIGGLVVAVALIGIIVYGVKSNSAPGPLDNFATCLKNSGAVFYGAFWCPHCQSQKKLFGNSAKKLPYVECSTPDGTSQNQTCNDKKIEGYPTWIFADGSILTGEQTLEQLSEKTACPIDNSTTTPGIVTSTATSTLKVSASVFAGSSSPVK